MIGLYRLKISHKLIISSVTFLLPVSVLFYFYVQYITGDIQFTKLEIKGCELIKPIQVIVNLIPQQHRLAIIYSQGNKQFQKRMNDIGLRMNDAFTELLSKTEQFGNDIKISDKSLGVAGMANLFPGKIKQRWESLQSKLDYLSRNKCDAEYVALTNEIHELIGIIKDKSNLILDPDLDSYYMMSLSSIDIPEAQRRLGDIMVSVEKTLAEGQITDEKSLNFAIFAFMIEEVDMKKISESSVTSLSEDKNFYGLSPSLQKNIPPKLQLYEKSAKEFTRVLRQFSHLKDSAIKRSELDEIDRAGTQLADACAALWETGITELNVLLEKRIDSHKNKVILTFCLTLATLILASVLLYAVSRGITKPLSNVMDIAGEISKGQVDKALEMINNPIKRSFTVKYNGVIKDEILSLYKAIDSMTKALYSLLTQIQKSTLQVTSTTNEIEAQAHQLEATVTEQAASTNEVTATSKEISSRSQQLLQTMNDVSKIASETALLAGQGQNSLQSMETAMRELMNATTFISSKLSSISEKASDISSIVITIKKVADQTNLLSLNASIEAEKAGEYGLGFAVVAREIRRLADQTAVSTMNIEEMVEQMQSAVSSGVMEMDKFIQQVRHGGENINAIGEQLAKIINYVQKLIPQFEDVNKTMQDQSVGAENISFAMTQLSETADNTRMSLSEFNKATCQLAESVMELKREFTKFKIES